MTDTIVYQHIGNIEPTVNLDGLRVGDYWLDTSDGIVKKCTSISSQPTWEEKTTTVASIYSGGEKQVSSITFNPTTNRLKVVYKA